jgi:glycosyltransferase involved in cell wall biosynthesis
MKLLIIANGAKNDPATRIRAIEYIPQLKKIGFENITWQGRVPEKGDGLFGSWLLFPLIKRWYALKIALLLIFGKWDLIFIQTYFVPLWILKLLRRKKQKLIFDFDDAIFMDNEGLPKYEKETANMVKYADAVVVSTPFLEKFALKYNKNVHVISTPVDISPKKQARNNPITIGWIGSSSTTVHLESIKGVIEKSIAELNCNWLIMGAAYRFTENKRVEFRNWDKNAEKLFLQAIDIGVMPLLDIEFSKGKGGYKLLLYMSAGIPVVASPVGYNVEIVKEGVNGFLAKTEEEWLNAFRNLQSDNDLWQSMSANCYNEAKEKYSRDITFEKLKGDIENTHTEYTNKLYK